MIRKYLPGNRRLHVWTKRVEIPTSTRLHTHPWDFESRVLRGKIVSRVYGRDAGEPTHQEWKLHCGAVCQLVGEGRPVRLQPLKVDRISAGWKYWLFFDEIHESEFEEGTVTLIERTLRGPPDYAQVFLELGKEFVSNPVRPATEEEIEYAERTIAGLEIPS